jgi:IS5 family transposase
MPPEPAGSAAGAVATRVRLGIGVAAHLALADAGYRAASRRAELSEVHRLGATAGS